jgi:hypothetical protein
MATGEKRSGPRGCCHSTRVDAVRGGAAHGKILKKVLSEILLRLWRSEWELGWVLDSDGLRGTRLHEQKQCAEPEDGGHDEAGRELAQGGVRHQRTDDHAEDGKRSGPVVERNFKQARQGKEVKADDGGNCERNPAAETKMLQEHDAEPYQQAFGSEDDSEPHAGAFAFGCGDGVVRAGNLFPCDKPRETECEQQGTNEVCGWNRPARTGVPEDKGQEAP